MAGKPEARLSRDKGLQVYRNYKRACISWGLSFFILQFRPMPRQADTAAVCLATKRHAVARCYIHVLANRELARLLPALYARHRSGVMALSLKETTVFTLFSPVLKRKRLLLRSGEVSDLVMIVDDHAVIRGMLRNVFEAEDLEVSDAADGFEGVQRARELKPSLIILDLSMPIMNGLEAARKLKMLMPHVPLLMFTNNAGDIVEKEARSAGISAVVWKSAPNWREQLLAHVKSLLGLDGASV